MPKFSSQSQQLADLDMLYDKVRIGVMIVDQVEKRAANPYPGIEVRFILKEVPNPLGIQGTGEYEFLRMVDQVRQGGYVKVTGVDINMAYPIGAVFSSLGRKVHKGFMEAVVEFSELPAGPSLTFTQAVRRATAWSNAIQQAGFVVPGEPIKPLKDLGLSIEPIVAFRDWKILREGIGLYLASRNDRYWPHRAKLVAECHGNIFGHDAPNESCGCGIYAFNKTAEGQKIWFKSSLEVDVHAFGTVNIWGEILIGPYGFRAEFAYPKEVFIRDNGTRRVKHVADELTEAYGIPVTVVGDPLTASMGDTLEELKGGESQ